MNSIIQNEKVCFICGSVRDLERHHCIHGTANRRLAEEDGLTVWLCHDCHMNLHDKGEFDKALQSIAMNAWVRKYGNKQDFRRRYGKYFE